MRNPHETPEMTEARHRREAAERIRYVEQEKDRQLQSLRDEIKRLQQETPDPSNWQLVDAQEIKPFTVLKLKYNVKLHDGVKILVYRAPFVDLVKQRLLDPHFGGEATTGHKVAHYPIARFAPTDEGWQDAIAFAAQKSRQ